MRKKKQNRKQNKIKTPDMIGSDMIRCLKTGLCRYTQKDVIICREMAIFQDSKLSFHNNGVVLFCFPKKEKKKKKKKNKADIKNSQV